ncbi:uncharacterized protein B0H18DRAFT_511780 [Fomitopsis serialis]|uniref:uncharacterized protein n=1 Tax=Fomitopsis serialis TaxID=139415 RepID=UPI0020080E5E|nr:uncharacterized protein B0H18DRAFT_511780 [Neoantrodia serialis]KAH9922451.1 hypothetical protein B0H18DRAFT_511780 [Neoantrodia serialis]
MGYSRALAPRPRRRRRALLWVIKELSDFFPASVKTFVLRGGTQEIDTEVWARMLAAFPAIEHLEIIAEEDAMPDFPAALEPTFSGDVPCPGLRELVLRYQPGEVSDHSRLLAVLRSALQQRLEKGSRLASLSLKWECRSADDVDAFTGSVVNQVLPELRERTLVLSRLVGSLKMWATKCQRLEICGIGICWTCRITVVSCPPRSTIP